MPASPIPTAAVTGGLAAVLAGCGGPEPDRVVLRVVARRVDGYAVRGVARADGTFMLHLRFRRVADDTFTVSVDARGAAPRKVLLTAICLDCLACSPSPPPS